MEGMMKLEELKKLVSAGESETLEFKKSTGELRQGLETLCAFLNRLSGHVLFGVNRNGAVEGQQVSEQTFHEISAQLQRIEPPVQIEIERIRVKTDREVIALKGKANHEAGPFTFDSRPFERVGNTTRKMPQVRYEELLLSRAHARRRWENQPAVDVNLEDLDHEEILRTREAAIRQRHISAGTSMEIGDILDRLGLRRNGVITQAALVLYGKSFMPDYPQCLLKMARFRGLTVTGDILDSRQDHLHAFAMMREGMAFLDRTLPLASHFTEGKILREDRLPVPPDALREILLNAVIHRDYSTYSGYVAIAVFDDRVEIRSTGLLPPEITVDMLSGPHLSKLRNPLIADAFHRVGAIEAWGRGTNRVIEECRKYGIESPMFREESGMLIVSFRAQIKPDSDQRHHEGTKSAPSRHQVGTKPGPSRDHVMILEQCREEKNLAILMSTMGRSDRTKFRDQFIKPLLETGLLEMTIPDKPKSSRQKYRTTEAGLEKLREKG
jgi:ATP-dependent DNA helicase RecG